MPGSGSLSHIELIHISCSLRLELKRDKLNTIVKRSLKRDEKAQLIGRISPTNYIKTQRQK